MQLENRTAHFVPLFCINYVVNFITYMKALIIHIHIIIKIEFEYYVYHARDFMHAKKFYACL